MKEAIIGVLVAGSTGFFGWLFGKMQTRREKKRTDLELINDAITPMIHSIRQVTEKNNELVSSYLALQAEKIRLIDEKSQLLAEREELMEKIERLEKQIRLLNKKVSQYICHYKKNNNDEGDLPCAKYTGT